VPPANPRPDANASAVCPLDRHAETRFAHVDAFAIGHTIAPPSQAARTVAVQRLQSWFDAADLAPETAAAAARVDAVMGVESIAEIAERYRVAEAEITPHEVSIPSEEGLPEEVLGLTVCFRYAG
jgi:hypothetical protein